MYKQFNPVFEQDVYQAIDLINCVNKRNIIGGPAKEQVEKQIELVEKELDILK